MTVDGDATRPIDEMRVVDLRAALTARGLPADGRKATLRARLEDSIGGGGGDEIVGRGDEEAAEDEGEDDDAGEEEADDRADDAREDGSSSGEEADDASARRVRAARCAGIRCLSDRSRSTARADGMTTSRQRCSREDWRARCRESSGRQR